MSWLVPPVLDLVCLRAQRKGRSRPVRGDTREWPVASYCHIGNLIHLHLNFLQIDSLHKYTAFPHQTSKNRFRISGNKTKTNDDHKTAVSVFAFCMISRKLKPGSIINSTAGLGEIPLVSLFRSNRRAILAVHKAFLTLMGWLYWKGAPHRASATSALVSGPFLASYDFRALGRTPLAFVSFL
mmetsp:Transcript_10686/g.24926  ORF Transcript_10686/g.24926 Transcript_10686/m.24926 type:complete len:183 (-) Transcript_10686:640-1188(-)